MVPAICDIRGVFETLAVAVGKRGDCNMGWLAGKIVAASKGEYGVVGSAIEDSSHEGIANCGASVAGEERFVGGKSIAGGEGGCWWEVRL